MQIKGKYNIRGFFIQAFRKNWLFTVAFAGMVVYLKFAGPMNNWSGDAASIWETIKSFYSGEIVSSYVLYKGFASVFPYAWLYQLSLLFSVGEFFFVKLYHCLLFAYITTVGLPYLIENLLHIRAKVWRKAILMLVLFWLWKNNGALNQIMVDLPGMAFFLMLVNSALKATTANRKRSYGRFIYTGLLLGLNLCVSGQYTAAALCIILYLVIKVIPRKVLKEKSTRWGALLCIVILLVSMVGILACNSYFEKKITNPLREQGEWIPSGQTWLEIGFTRFLGVSRNGVGPTIPDNRGLSIAMDLDKDLYESMLAGSVPINIGQYFDLVAKYPLDFLTRYANRFFLALSPDGGKLSATHLFAAYTLLFIPFVSLKKRCKMVRQFFSAKLLLVLSFVFAIAAVLVLNIEMRYVMQIEGLIYSLALLDNTLWDGLNSLRLIIKECWAQKSLLSLSQKRFPYTFVFYMIFMLFCFTHMASLYEMLGIEPSIVLFQF